MPANFQVLVRVVRVDEPIDVGWDGPGQIVITAPQYRGNFLLSHDLREFDTPLHSGVSVNLQTPLGVVSAETSDSMARVTLRLTPDAQREPILFYYYAEGRIQALAARP